MSRLRWARVRTAFRHREGPFAVIAPNPNTQALQKLLDIARNFMGPDGKIDRSKLKRLERLQRKEMINSGAIKPTAREVIANDVFLAGTYIFDTLSPHRVHMGNFTPLFAIITLLMVGMTFAYMSGQYEQYAIELQFRGCEEQQAIATASALEIQSATDAMTAAVRQAAAQAAGLSAAAAAAVAQVQAKTVSQNLVTKMKKNYAAGALAAAEKAQQERQAEIGPEIMTTVHTAKRTGELIQSLESKAAGPSDARQRLFEENPTEARRRALSGDSNLTEEEKLQLREAYATKDEAQARNTALYDESAALQVTTSKIEHQMLAAEKAGNAASTERKSRVNTASADAAALSSTAAARAAAAEADLAQLRAQQADLYNTYDPYAALRTIDPNNSKMNEHSIVLLRQKMSQYLSSNGYGSAEHSCSLFEPKAPTRRAWIDQLNAWVDELADEFLVRWGARYAPKVLGENQGGRFIASAFVHASWAAVFVSMVAIGTLGVFCEKRYGTLRYAAVFILSQIGGNFMGAMADENCYVFAGAAPACFGLAAMYWLDVAVEAFEKYEHHGPAPHKLFAAAFATLLEIVMAGIGKASLMTNLGGLITGGVITILFLPKFLMEDLEAVVPWCTVLVAFIIFVILPVVYYGTVDTPVCAFHADTP